MCSVARLSTCLTSPLRECKLSCINITVRHRSLYPNRFGAPQGSSGGAIAGSALFFDVDLDALMEYVITCVEEARLVPRSSRRAPRGQQV